MKINFKLAFKLNFIILKKLFNYVSKNFYKLIKLYYNNNMKTKEKILSSTVHSELKKIFPSPVCELNFVDDYTLMVSVILSAQCTDKRVNSVTPILFSKYPSFQALKDADIKEVEKIIYPCGFYKNKAKSIINASKDVCYRFSGKLPSNLADLTSLSGVGRKTANVLISNLFNKPAIAVDTHVFRVSNRLGIANAKNVLECEMQLQENIDKNLWSEMHHLMVLFGRYICKARSPLCQKCSLAHLCKFYAQSIKNEEDKKEKNIQERK